MPEDVDERNKQRMSRRRFLKYGTAVTIVVAAGGAGYYLLRREQPATPPITANQTQTETTGSATQQLILNNDLNEVEDSTSALYGNIKGNHFPNLTTEETKQLVDRYIATNVSESASFKNLIGNLNGESVKSWNEKHQPNPANDSAGQGSSMWQIKEMQKQAIQSFNATQDVSALEMVGKLFPEAIEVGRRLGSICRYGDFSYKSIEVSQSLFEKYKYVKERVKNALDVPGGVENSGALLTTLGLSKGIDLELDLKDTTAKRFGSRKRINICPDLEETFEMLAEKMSSDGRAKFIEIAEGQAALGFFPLNNMLRELFGTVEKNGNDFLTYHATRVENGILRGSVKDIPTLDYICSPTASISHRGTYEDDYYHKNLEYMVPDHLKMSTLEIGKELMRKLPQFRYDKPFNNTKDVWESNVADCTCYTMVFNVIMRNMGIGVNALHEYFLKPVNGANYHIVSVVPAEDGKKYVFDPLYRKGPLELKSYMSGRDRDVFIESYPSGTGTLISTVYDALSGETTELPSIISL